MSEDKLAETILKFQKHLQVIRDPYEDIWRDVADHVVPIRENIKGDKPEGARQGTKIYDGNPIIAVQMFADGLHGYLISPSTLWFRLTLETPVQHALNAMHPGAMQRGPQSPYISGYETLGDVPEVREWLQETGQALYRAYQRSNYYSAMTPFFEDGGTIGTATKYSQENLSTGKVVFTPIHPGQAYIAEDQYGEVDTVFRKDQLEAKKVLEKFGKNKLSDQIKQATENEPYKKFDFIHAVYPRKKRNPDKKDGLNKPFASIWVDVAEQKVVHHWGYDMLPYSVWRYRKNSNETYGRSPAMFALADIMGLNQIGKTMLGAARLSVDPAYNVPAELEGKVKITPHGFNYYNEDPKRIVTAVRDGINFPIGVDREERKTQAIEKHFHVDFFLMLARAPRQMTATEILERQGEKAALLGTAVGRLSYECLDHDMDRMFQIGTAAGWIPQVPEIMMEYAGGNIGIDYMGPLAQMQKRLFRTQGITQGLAALQPVMEVFPTVSDIINPDEMGREVLEAHGFPQRAIFSAEEVAETRKARAEMEQAEAQRVQQAEGLEGIKTLAEADRAAGGKISDAMIGPGVEA